MASSRLDDPDLFLVVDDSIVRSTIVFHSPQLAHLPSHLTYWAWQFVHICRVFDLAMYSRSCYLEIIFFKYFHKKMWLLENGASLQWVYKRLRRIEKYILKIDCFQLVFWGYAGHWEVPCFFRHIWYIDHSPVITSVF